MFCSLGELLPCSKLDGAGAGVLAPEAHPFLALAVGLELPTQSPGPCAPSRQMPGPTIRYLQGAWNLALDRNIVLGIPPLRTKGRAARQPGSEFLLKGSLGAWELGRKAGHVQLAGKGPRPEAPSS